MTAPGLVYTLCFLTCAGCAALLVRAWLKTKTRLLMWTAWSFVFLAFNNFFLLADMILLPSVDLTIPRYVAGLLGVATMIIGFIWEAE
jgi:hypothetical protein